MGAAGGAAAWTGGWAAGAVTDRLKGAGVVEAGLFQEVGGAAGVGRGWGGGQDSGTGAGQDAGHRHGVDAPSAPMVGGSEVEAPVDECVICFEGEKTHMVYPCGHVALCGDCAGLIGKSLHLCPVHFLVEGMELRVCCVNFVPALLRTRVIRTILRSCPVEPPTTLGLDRAALAPETYIQTRPASNRETSDLWTIVNVMRRLYQEPRHSTFESSLRGICQCGRTTPPQIAVSSVLGIAPFPFFFDATIHPFPLGVREFRPRENLRGT